MQGTGSSGLRLRFGIPLAAASKTAAKTVPALGRPSNPSRIYLALVRP
ncbi:MAG: hypothetical protein NZM65_00685 [Flavobacteriales bacterium]|nr:hypothetical protein [Flavobacteriales bacterium]MDW8409184.1 hypothetical protein [Flavobacteriales bacterium]